MARTADAHLMSNHLPRRARRSSVAGYSRFVGIAKLLLLTLAGGLIVLLVVWSRINLDESRLRLGVTDYAPKDIDSLNMVNPRFAGIDAENRPFNITADQATQADEQGRIIALTEPKADVTLTNGAWIALTADAGRYDREADQLKLSGSVNLFHDRGFELQTSRAKIDLKDGIASGNEAVRGHGPAGKLVAEGFRITDGGDRIVLTGHSRIILRPSETRASDAGASDAGASETPGEVPGNAGSKSKGLGE
jgi:lipopolysaccharide export system protein LptC